MALKGAAINTSNLTRANTWIGKLAETRFTLGDYFWSKIFYTYEHKNQNRWAMSFFIGGYQNGKIYTYSEDQS